MVWYVCTCTYCSCYHVTMVLHTYVLGTSMGGTGTGTATGTLVLVLIH